MQQINLVICSEKKSVPIFSAEKILDDIHAKGYADNNNEYFQSAQQHADHFNDQCRGICHGTNNAD